MTSYKGNIPGKNDDPWYINFLAMGVLIIFFALMFIFDSVKNKNSDLMFICSIISGYIAYKVGKWRHFCIYWEKVDSALTPLGWYNPTIRYGSFLIVTVTSLCFAYFISAMIVYLWLGIFLGIIALVGRWFISMYAAWHQAAQQIRDRAYKNDNFSDDMVLRHEAKIDAMINKTQNNTEIPKRQSLVEDDGRFYKYSDDTVLDKQTNLMWAAKDNGCDINFGNAQIYCKNYRGGSYADWRMPSLNELANLFDSSKSYMAPHRSCYVHLTSLIELTTGCPWASEGSVFIFDNGERIKYQSHSSRVLRVLPVRNAA